jgi:hypothetical protein
LLVIYVERMLRRVTHLRHWSNVRINDDLKKISYFSL